MRLLILIALVYIGYRAFKSWMTSQPTDKASVTKTSSGEIDDVMVKDPFCEIYFPKRNGIPLRYGEKDYYFCSTTCRDKFVEALRRGDSEKNT